MRNAFLKELLACAAEDERVFLITADLGYSVVEAFAEKFPKRFLNIGIAEQNAVGVAAGLSMSGFKPFVYSIIPFATMRCFEQVRVDVAYQQNPVTMVGVGAGLGYGPAGATHHAVEDIAIMRALPGMRVVCPGDPHETRALTRQLVQNPGPTYLRLGKGGDPAVHTEEVTLGRAVEFHAPGAQVALVTTSTMLDSTMKLRAALGVPATVLQLHTVKPLDTAALDRVAGLPLVTIEEHGPIGGLGSAVAEHLVDRGGPLRLLRIALPDAYTHHVGSQAYLREKLGLGHDAMLARIREFLR